MSASSTAMEIIAPLSIVTPTPQAPAATTTTTTTTSTASTAKKPASKKRKTDSDHQDATQTRNEDKETAPPPAKRAKKNTEEKKYKPGKKANGDKKKKKDKEGNSKSKKAKDQKAKEEAPAARKRKAPEKEESKEPDHFNLALGDNVFTMFNRFSKDGEEGDEKRKVARLQYISTTSVISFYKTLAERYGTDDIPALYSRWLNEIDFDGVRLYLKTFPKGGTQRRAKNWATTFPFSLPDQIREFLATMAANHPNSDILDLLQSPDVEMKDELLIEPLRKDAPLSVRRHVDTFGQGIDWANATVIGNLKERAIKSGLLDIVEFVDQDKFEKRRKLKASKASNVKEYFSGKGIHNIIGRCHHSKVLSTRDGEGQLVTCQAPIKYSKRSTAEGMRFIHFCAFGRKTNDVKIQFTNHLVPHMDKATPTGTTIVPECACKTTDPNHACISWKLIDPEKPVSRFNLDKASAIVQRLAANQLKNPTSLVDLFSSASETDEH